MNKDDADKLLRAACDFQGKSMASRQSCREQFRQKETSPENILRILVDGLIAGLAEKIAQKVDATNQAISYQLAVSASFIRTHFLISDHILDGDLVEALVLTRKQLESLARLHELDAKPFQKLMGKVPNIQNVLQGESKRLYGHLSEVAHFSTPRVAELLHVAEKGELIGPSLLPVYSERSAACLEMNIFVAVYFLGWIIEKLSEWYAGYDSTHDKQLLGECILVALDTGVLRIPDGESS